MTTIQQQNLKTRFFLGAITQRREEWYHWYSEPTPPANVTRPETAARKIAEKQAAQEAAAHRYPFGGFAAEIDVISADGQHVAHFAVSEETDDSWASVNFVRLISSDSEFEFVRDIYPRDHPSHLNDVNVRWFGFDIRDNLQIIAADVFRYNAQTPGNPIEVPVSMWYYRPFTPAPYLDPYETLVPPTLRKGDVDLGALCEFCQINVPLDINSSALARAELARKLTLRGQLFPVPDEFM